MRPTLLGRAQSPRTLSSATCPPTPHGGSFREDYTVPSRATRRQPGSTPSQSQDGELLTQDPFITEETRRRRNTLISRQTRTPGRSPTQRLLGHIHRPTMTHPPTPDGNGVGNGLGRLTVAGPVHFSLYSLAASGPVEPPVDEGGGVHTPPVSVVSFCVYTAPFHV